jgi:superfamily II DNA or RNA helicase
VTAPLPTPAAPGRPLRAWQRQALQVYRDAAATDFLVTATPGAGKTAFALALAGELLAARVVDRMIVVCPTDHLRTQWAEAALAFGVGSTRRCPTPSGRCARTCRATSRRTPRSPPARRSTRPAPAPSAPW